MGFFDVAITVGLTSVGFLAGFLARGLFGEGQEDEWAALEPVPSQYEPPRRGDDRL